MKQPTRPRLDMMTDLSALSLCRRTPVKVSSSFWDWIKIPHMTWVHTAQLTLTSYYHKHGMGVSVVYSLASKQYGERAAMTCCVETRPQNKLKKDRSCPCYNEKSKKCCLRQIVQQRLHSLCVWQRRNDDTECYKVMIRQSYSSKYYHYVYSLDQKFSNMTYVF